MIESFSDGHSCVIYEKVDFFASDIVKKGERREALWSAGNVFACIIRLILTFLYPMIEPWPWNFVFLFFFCLSLFRINSYVWYNWRGLEVNCFLLEISPDCHDFWLCFGLQVRLPYPLEASLVSMYGPDYMTRYYYGFKLESTTVVSNAFA